MERRPDESLISNPADDDQYGPTFGERSDPRVHRGRVLAECIESVLAEDYRRWEYHIVNNCSTDDTLRIAQSYADKDPRIRVRTNETFVNVAENHNIAFGLISPESQSCKVVSADDWIMPECLAEMVGFAEALPPSALWEPTSVVVIA